MDFLPIISFISTSEIERWVDGALGRDTKVHVHLEEEILDLYGLYRLRLLRYVVSLGLRVHDAEDVVQEVFLALFRHLEAKGSRSNLPGWVFRVTHRLALKRRTKYKAEEFIEGEERLEYSAAATPTPEDEALFAAQQLRLRRIFLALPEADRMCLQLRAEGLTYRDIAGVLGVSLGSVYNSLTRSLKRLGC